MAEKKPFTYTAVSYIHNISGDGSIRLRQKVVFEQVPSPKGTYRFKPIKQTVYMFEEEQLECDRKMMGHASEILSDYLSNHLEECD